jgi:Flp pilus assembly protein TadG
MKVQKMRSLRGSSGQSLLETALMMPLMLAVVLNAVNLGYFFFVTLNLTSAARIGAEYAMLGPGSPGTTNYPLVNAGTLSVSSLIYNDLTGAVWNPTNTTIQVCSPSVIVSGKGTSGSGTATVANCIKCTSSASCSSASGTTGANATWIPDADPEAPLFVTSRVDVTYSFPPLIPGTPFNLVLAGSAFSSGQYTFNRHIEMRAM